MCAHFCVGYFINDNKKESSKIKQQLFEKMKSVIYNSCLLRLLEQNENISGHFSETKVLLGFVSFVLTWSFSHRNENKLQRRVFFLSVFSESSAPQRALLSRLRVKADSPSSTVTRCPGIFKHRQSLSSAEAPPLELQQHTGTPSAGVKARYEPVFFIKMSCMLSFYHPNFNI